jgi:hypothetical protein
MTIANSPQNISLDDQRNSRVDIFDDKGRFDPVQTEAANREIFQEANTVKVAGSTAIDPVLTAAKRLATKIVVLARKK